VILLSPPSTDVVRTSWTTAGPAYAARVRTAFSVTRHDAERGSILPLVLLCWLLGALMAFGAIAASDAFLEQRDVQSVCDGAALAAAGRTDEGAVYANGVGTQLALTDTSTQAAVAEHLAAQAGPDGARLDAWSVSTDGAEVTVRCTRYTDIAFGWLFLGGRPLERTAVASARAPTAP
jgi:uncharacterized membrane protein